MTTLKSIFSYQIQITYNYNNYKPDFSKDFNIPIGNNLNVQHAAITSA